MRGVTGKEGKPGNSFGFVSTVKLLRMVPPSKNNDLIGPHRASCANPLQIIALHKQGPCHVDEYLSNSGLWLIMLRLSMS